MIIIPIHSNMSHYHIELLIYVLALVSFLSRNIAVWSSRELSPIGVVTPLIISDLEGLLLHIALMWNIYLVHYTPDVRVT